MVGPTEVAADGSSAVFDFGTPTGSAEAPATPGAVYHLCWGPEGEVEDLLVELDPVGELTGPELNEFECTLGLPCGLGLTGYELSVTSSIVVLSAGSCGDADAVVAAWTGSVNTEVSLQVAGYGYGYGYGYTTAAPAATSAGTPAPTPAPTTTTTTTSNTQSTTQGSGGDRLLRQRRLSESAPSELPLGFYELGTPTGLLALNTDGTPTGLAPGP